MAALLLAPRTTVYIPSARTYPAENMKLPLTALLSIAMLLPLALAGCGAQSQAQRIDERTYRIEGPRIAGGVTGPNRRLAEELCPHGYRILDSTRDNDPTEGGTTFTWTVRCL